MPFAVVMLEWLLFSAAWIAVCAVALSIESTIILQAAFPAGPILLFAGASAFCHYNLHYFVRERDEALSARDRWSQRHRYWFAPAVIISGLVSTVCLFYFSVSELIAVAVLAAVSLFYSLPLLPGGFRLKQLGVCKPFILAAVWTIVTVWLPAHQTDPWLLSLVLSRRFVFMLVLCLAFDIRDQQKDQLQSIRTIPIRFGAKLTYYLMDGLLVLFAILALLVEWQLGRLPILIALMLSAIVTKVVIRMTTRYTSELYYLGVIDGMMVMQALLVVVASLAVVL